MKNILYAQSGGVTAVINATAAGVIETALGSSEFGTVFAAKDGILGVLNENLIDTRSFEPEAIARLTQTPGGAFGSCRHKLKSLNDNRAEYERLIEVFKAHEIGFFFYNGGGDSQDTAYKVSQIGEQLGYPIRAIGIPKTIDNDLPFTDNCPGFGSVAKYVAIATLEASLDVMSMSSSSTKVFILEVMGRHAGWIAAASGLAQRFKTSPPHVILFPEIPFDEEKFLAKVSKAEQEHGYCTIVVSEGVKDSNGNFLSASTRKDAFGHSQLGGVAPTIAALVSEKLGLKHHWAVADYLQRSARHIASATDVEQAYALGKAAVEMAKVGQDGVMPIIVRESDSPYRWHIGQANLKDVANQEKTMPLEFISEDGFSITESCRKYLLPLIQGEAYPTYTQGLPDYVQLEKTCVDQFCTSKK